MAGEPSDPPRGRGASPAGRQLREAGCHANAARGDAASGPAVLMLGYGQTAEPAIRAGVRELAEAVRAARRATV